MSRVAIQINNAAGRCEFLIAKSSATLLLWLLRFAVAHAYRPDDIADPFVNGSRLEEDLATNSVEVRLYIKTRKGMGSMCLWVMKLPILVETYLR